MKTLALAAALTVPLALTPVTSDADRFELTGGHVDAFYVYNLPAETTVGDDVQTRLHLKVKEDVTGSGRIHDPNKVKFVSTERSYSCFDGRMKDWFAALLPGVDGAYVSDKADLPYSETLNPGYTTHVKFPDRDNPNDRDSDWSDDGITLTFSDVTGPEGGSLVLYGVGYNLATNTQTLETELEDGKYIIADGAKWELSRSHHHAKWLATKAGTYRFKAQAVAKFEPEDGSPQEFASDTVEYVWEFKESAMEGACGSTAKPAEPGDTPGMPEPGDPDAPGPADTVKPEPASAPSTPDAKPEPTPSTPAEPNTPTPGAPDTTPRDAAPEDAVVLDHGHADIFNVSAKDGKLKLNLKEDVTAQGRIRTPEKVTLKVVEAAREVISPSVYPGIITSGYLLPFGEKKGVLWPGWETLHVRPEFSHIDLHFEKVSGPGRVQLLTPRGIEGLVPLLADGSIDLKDGSVLPVPEPTHVHANWIFESPGEYVMKVHATGKNAAGELVTSNTATYTWHVGNFAAPAPGGDANDEKPGTDGREADKPGAGTPGTDKPAANKPADNGSEPADKPAAEKLAGNVTAAPLGTGQAAGDGVTHATGSGPAKGTGAAVTAGTGPAAGAGTAGTGPAAGTAKLPHTGASTSLLATLAALFVAGGATLAVYRKRSA